MRVFTIYHKPSGLYMPTPSGRNGSGSSYWEPIEDFTVGRMPRLFPTKRAAKAALTQWLKGQHKSIDYLEHGEMFGRPHLVRDHVEVIPVPSRKAEDMEIVEFTLTPV